MSSHVHLVFCALIILSVISYGLTIKCFSCRSDYDPNCGNPFNNSTVAISDCDFIRELPHLPGVRSNTCRKIREKVNGIWIYTRDCADPGETVSNQGDGEFCVTKTGLGGNYTEYCTCNDTNLCNASYTFTPVPVLSVMLLALFKVLV